MLTMTNRYNMTQYMTRYMKQFDTMKTSLNFKRYTLHFTGALRLAALLLVMIVGVQSVWMK